MHRTLCGLWVHGIASGSVEYPCFVPVCVGPVRKWAAKGARTCLSWPYCVGYIGQQSPICGGTAHRLGAWEAGWQVLLILHHVGVGVPAPGCAAESASVCDCTVPWACRCVALCAYCTVLVSMSACCACVCCTVPVSVSLHCHVPAGVWVDGIGVLDVFSGRLASQALLPLGRAMADLSQHRPRGSRTAALHACHV